MTDPQPQAGTTVRLRGIRRTAARRMVEAWKAPMFHLTADVDFTEVLASAKRRDGTTVTDLLLAAAAHALLAVPEVNVLVGDEELTQFEHADIGIAAATPKGLLVPVLRAVDTLGIREISSRRRELVDKARQGTLTLDEMSGGTFSISNLGMTSVTRFDAILNPPQAAILAVGATRRVPFPGDDDAVTWRPVAALTLTADHRAFDGATGAAFLAALEAWMANPEEHLAA
ncbi:MAG: 2-oxo acid dehydrogenase subunit E2 [Mycetocola sp.]